MKLLSKLRPEWALRLGLGTMYLFSAYDIWKHPTAWYWAIRPLPQALQVIINNQIGLDRYLKFQAAGEFVLALVFLAWFLPRRFLRLAAFLAALEMALILVFVGVDGITFRDIGLLGAALALVALSYR
ncbi:MAG: hypothetical protein AAB844_00465 [Patescibacteria group bacterium]